MAQEVDVIQHLLEVEREASAIIQQAQDEADATLAAARAQADTAFRDQYAQMHEGIEQQAKERMDAAIQLHDTAIRQYKQDISGRPQDTAAFGTLMDSLLFGRA